MLSFRLQVNQLSRVGAYTYFTRELSEGSQLHIIKWTCETTLEKYQVPGLSKASCDGY